MVAKAGACHARRRLLPALTYVHCIARTELRRRATGGQANPAAGGRAWTRATGAGITWLDAQIATGNLPPRQTVQQHTHKLLISLVGLPRFELGTSCTPSKRDTRLRYSPTFEIYFPLYHNELRAQFHVLGLLLEGARAPCRYQAVTRHI